MYLGPHLYLYLHINIWIYKWTYFIYIYFHLNRYICIVINIKQSNAEIGIHWKSEWQNYRNSLISCNSVDILHILYFCTLTIESSWITVWASQFIMALKEDLTYPLFSLSRPPGFHVPAWPESQSISAIQGQDKIGFSWRMMFLSTLNDLRPLGSLSFE